MVDAAEEIRVDNSGDSAATGGDPDILDGEGAFTAFRMQRLTCLFRLDATPKRRPQVSQTKATRVSSDQWEILLSDKMAKHTLFSGMYEEVLKTEKYK